MNREEFEHVIRAAADVVHDELVVVGSQAVLAEFPDPPASLVKSMELDIYPRSDPTKADEIDGAWQRARQRSRSPVPPSRSSRSGPCHFTVGREACIEHAV